MGFNIFQILYALIALSFFIIMIFTNKDKNIQYLKFVLLAFPFMTITINVSLIEIAVFDLITFSFLILFYTPKASSLKLNGTYYNLFLLLLKLDTIKNVNIAKIIDSRFFYQKIKDIYTTSIDYNPKDEQTLAFFKIIKNKLLWAISQNTATELVYRRIAASRLRSR